MDKPIVILLPVYNDWKSLNIVLDSVDKVIEVGSNNIEVLIVDDGSSIDNNYLNFNNNFKTINKITVITLIKNMGNQRAITIGLCHIEEKIPCKSVIIMDSDGEDRAEDIPKLIRKCHDESEKKIVFAKRKQRSASMTFKVFYLLYKVIFKILTGSIVNFGNFSIIPKKILSRLVIIPEIADHYPAAVIKSRTSFTTIDTKRAPRIYGKSKINFSSLVIHGLSGIAVFGDVVGVRMIISLFSLLILFVLLVISITLLRIFGPIFPTGWASTSIFIFTLIIFQTILLLVVSSFSILTGKSKFPFLFNQNYQNFILSVKKTYSN